MTRRCTECGSTDIEVDTTRADAVCTSCGAVLESSIIVSDIQFEENAHGGSSAIGTFVSSDSKGGKLVGNNFTSSIGRESREITLKNARRKIVTLAEQLRLRPDHIDMSFYFFKMALSKHLTRGRKSAHVIAACVYITCRTEGTSHMLIDFSDILQIDVYELGRTYLRLSQGLCINIPAMDPCLYVMRFAHRLEFGEKTHEVSMTALRLVSRMKKDWIHFGRRPSGLCGAALLIAGRLHDFSRSINDVIKVVKVHESTLRKRLNEFGETPASQLTLEEFMTVDLDAMTEEQDPPSFKAARKRDKERLSRLDEDENLEKEMTRLEEQIVKELEDRKGKQRGIYSKLARERSSSSEEVSSPSISDTDENLEENETARFLNEETMGIISQCLDGKVDAEITSQEQLDYLLMPPPAVTPVRHSVSPSKTCVNSPGMGLRNSVEDYLTASPQTNNSEDDESEECEELDLNGIDEDEIDSYIMTDEEIQQKTMLWLKLNAEYLKEQEEKIKREKLEREELIKAGKDPDKKRKVKKKKMNLHANGSAIEAIEKIVQEKKISTKINYDVLKSLNMSPSCKNEDSLPSIAQTPLRSPAEKRLASPAPEPPKRIKSEEGRPRAKPNLPARTKARTKPSDKSEDSPRRPVNFSNFLDSKSARSSKESSNSDESDSQEETRAQGVTPLQLSSSASKITSATEITSASDIASAASSEIPSALQDRLEVVEEGPETDSANNAETETEDEGEEDDDSELSAAQLLQRHMGEEDGGGGEYGEEDYY